MTLKSFIDIAANVEDLDKKLGISGQCQQKMDGMITEDACIYFPGCFVQRRKLKFEEVRALH